MILQPNHVTFDLIQVADPHYPQAVCYETHRNSTIAPEMHYSDRAEVLCCPCGLQQGTMFSPDTQANASTQPR